MQDYIMIDHFRGTDLTFDLYCRISFIHAVKHNFLFPGKSYEDRLDIDGWDMEEVHNVLLVFLANGVAGVAVLLLLEMNSVQICSY